MRWIRKMLAGLFRLPAPSPEDIAAITRKQYGPCVLCGEALTGHDIAELASVITSDPGPNRLITVDSLVRDRDWAAVAQFREWRGDADEVVYSAIRCPWSYQLCIARLESFTSMDLDDRVTNRDLLSDEESALLSSQVQLEWRTLPQPSK
jgi:hypothetical protein